MAVLFFCGITSVLAVIFGIVALSQIGKSNGREKGTGLAWVGIIVGGLFLLIAFSRAGGGG
jgi:hypothetical protein